MRTMACQITSLTIVYSIVCSKETLKLRANGLCEGISLVTGEFRAQWASSAEMFLFDGVTMKRTTIRPYGRVRRRLAWVHDMNKVLPFLRIVFDIVLCSTAIYVLWYTCKIKALLTVLNPLLWTPFRFTLGTLQWHHNEGDGVSNNRRLWPLWGEFTGDRWIPRTKGQ